MPAKSALIVINQNSYYTYDIPPICSNFQRVSHVRNMKLIMPKEVSNEVDDYVHYINLLSRMAL